ncbi:substrate-binding domain-containing protein, partial [Porphyromonas macacae]|uniref:substrate-binding domain-containing protein n=1 Tax=Porphyromonas macacae TaxID=28115 RepID=UPI0024AD1454
MKKTVITALLMSMVAASLYGQRVKGSDTVIPLSQKEAEGYMKENPSARLTITGGGSGVGFSALLEGTTDIAQASRRIKFSERQKMQVKGI